MIKGLLGMIVSSFGASVIFFYSPSKELAFGIILLVVGFGLWIDNKIEMLFVKKE